MHLPPGEPDFRTIVGGDKLEKMARTWREVRNAGLGQLGVGLRQGGEGRGKVRNTSNGRHQVAQ